MAVPRLLQDLMLRLEDLAQKKGTAGPGPLRFEFRAEALPEKGDPWIEAAAFLGVEAEEEISAPGAIEDLLRAGPEGRERTADLSISGDAEDPTDAAFEGILGRTARLRLLRPFAERPSFAGLCALAGRTAGLVVLEILDAPPVEAVLTWLEAAEPRPLHARPLILRLSAGFASDPKAAAQTLAQRAQELGLSLQVERTRWNRAPQRLPADHRPAILQKALQTAFAEFPELCPFPFLMARTVDGAPETLGLCPESKGPKVPRAEGWNGPSAVDLRRAFHGGAEPDHCLGCGLRSSVRASLLRQGAEEESGGFSV